MWHTHQRIILPQVFSLEERNTALRSDIQALRCEDKELKREKEVKLCIAAFLVVELCSRE